MWPIEPQYLNLNLVSENQFEILYLDIKKALDIEVKRFYFLRNFEESCVRGNHAHTNQEQILYKISGEAALTLTKQNGISTNWVLEDKALFIPRNHWIEVKMEPQSTILCLASESYEQLKSIHEKSKFLNLV
jgi:oxalate decarboxylase/phosphoglucose isomerase-like protein (cupin superfamily)